MPGPAMMTPRLQHWLVDDAIAGWHCGEACQVRAFAPVNLLNFFSRRHRSGLFSQTRLLT